MTTSKRFCLKCVRMFFSIQSFFFPSFLSEVALAGMKINVVWLTLKSKFVILILPLFQNIKNTMCFLVGKCMTQ